MGGGSAWKLARCLFVCCLVAEHVCFVFCLVLVDFNDFKGTIPGFLTLGPKNP